MDHIVATGTENVSAKYLLGISVYRYFHESLRLTFSTALLTGVLGRFAINTRRPDWRAWVIEFLHLPSSFESSFPQCPTVAFSAPARDMAPMAITS
jgi:hypothetical protein